MAVTFRPINFATDFDTFLDIRKRAELEVLGTEDVEKLSLQGYVERVIARFGDLAFWHMYHENTLIGQMELGCKDDHGFVYLFYLYPQHRNQGFFKLMHDKLLDVMQKKGFKQIGLATAPSNERVIGIYRHYGWLDNGIDKNKPEMLSFKLLFP